MLLSIVKSYKQIFLVGDGKLAPDCVLSANESERRTLGQCLCLCRRHGRTRCWLIHKYKESRQRQQVQQVADFHRALASVELGCIVVTHTDH